MKNCFFFLLAASMILISAAEKANDVRLYTIEGKYLNTEDERNKPAVKNILLDFFSVNCQPCRQHISDVQKTAQKYRNSGLFSFITALPSNPELNETEEKKLLSDFIKTNGITLPVVYDLYTLTAERFGVKKGDSITIPHYFLMDKRGVIIKQSENWKDMESFIDTVFKLNN